MSTNPTTGVSSVVGGRASTGGSVSSSVMGVSSQSSADDSLSNRLELSMPIEMRIEELRHRLHVESAVCEGARNAITIMSSTPSSSQRTSDSASTKKALQQAQTKLQESLQRISLLNLSWQRIFKQLPSPPPPSFLLQQQQQQSQSGMTLSLPKAAPVTGQLEVRLLGCQDLLEQVPDRHKRESTTFSIFDSLTLDKTPKALKSSSKTYTVCLDKFLICQFLRYLKRYFKILEICF